jgi:molybdate transport system regulatory protein
VAIGAPQRSTRSAVIADRACLNGSVERIAPGRERDEVVLALAGGDHWVGFAPHPCGLVPGARAGASVPASALVVAIG